MPSASRVAIRFVDPRHIDRSGFPREPRHLKTQSAAFVQTWGDPSGRRDSPTSASGYTSASAGARTPTRIVDVRFL